MNLYGERGPEDVTVKPRCEGDHRGKQCGRLLAEVVSRPWQITCPRCGHTNQVGMDDALARLAQTS